MNNNSNSNSNSNANNSNINDNNSSNKNNSSRKRRKRGYRDVTWLSQSLASDEAQRVKARTERNKKRNNVKFRRNDVSGNDKYKVIKWLHSHPNKTATDAKVRFPDILKTISNRAIQKWRKITPEDAEKFNKNEMKRNVKKAQGLFPTIEKEMVRRRGERVTKNRDRSQKWFLKESSKLLKDDEKLNELNLTEEEKSNISKFKASKGWMKNVMKRNDMKMKSKQSDRKMSINEYVELRVEFLKDERDIWMQLSILVKKDDGSFVLMKRLLLNADEVPFALTAKKRKQISKNGERVQLQTPPIVGDDKYRDGTFIPFIVGNGVLLFVCVILKGGSRIRERELPELNRKYGTLLLICCNKKGYMYVCIYVCVCLCLYSRVHFLSLCRLFVCLFRV